MREHNFLLQNALIDAVSTALTAIGAQSGVVFSKVIAREATEDDLPALACAAAHSAKNNVRS